MNMLNDSKFRSYLACMGLTLAGAWLLEVTGSMVPLALGGSLLLITTSSLVRSIWRADLQSGEQDALQSQGGTARLLNAESSDFGFFASDDEA